MRPNACSHFRRQKNHEQTFIGHTCFLHRDAHGDSIDLGPPVGKVCYDFADEVRTLGVFVSSNGSSPYLKPTGRVVIVSRSRLTN